MAQDHGLCRKNKQSQMVHRPPLQARVVAANRAVLATLNDDDPGAHGHGQVGAKQNERGQTMRAVGMAWQRRAGKQSRQNKAAADEHSRRTIRPAQALKQNNCCRRSGRYRP